MKQIIDITKHSPQKGDTYFLDCNVVMYLFYTNGSYGRELIYNYTLIISKIISADAQIYVTDVLLSEFVNTYIQTEFHRLARLNGWPHDKKYFKYTFRQTQEYIDLLLEIKYIITRQLLPITKRLNGDFINISLDDMFDTPDTFDFNDRYYVKCMNKENSYIVTNDADFSADGGCPIITNNRELLANM